MAVLEVLDLRAPVADGPALTDLNLEVGEFEIVGLTQAGAGGAGALLDCISGHRRVAGGRIRHRDLDITRMPPHRRVHLGIGRTFPDAGLGGSWTALEAVLAAQHGQIRYSAVGGMLGSPAAAATERAVAERARALLELCEIPQLAAAPLRSLSPPLRARAGLAAVLGTDPDVVLLDAPSRGLDGAQVDALAALLLRLRRDLGVTFLLSSVHLRLLEVCDHVHILDRGREVAQGPPGSLREHPAVQELLHGEEGRHGSA